MGFSEQPPFLYLLCIITALGGFLFGYDTGVVSGAMIMVEDDNDILGLLSKDEKAVWHEGIVTATIAAAAIFSFASGFVSQRFGRKPTILVASLIFTIGAIIMGVAGNKEVLLVGRIVVGVGIGFSSATVPMYIAEASPESIRGVLITINQLMITLGILVSSIVDGAFAEVDVGWRYDFGIGAFPSVFLMIGFFFCPESPRWLVSRDRINDARLVLKKIRAETYDVEKELNEIIQVCAEDRKIQEQNGGLVVVRMMKSSYIRKALLVGCILQLLQQAAGINTVMYYSATIVEMAGLSSSASTNIWIAVGVNAVNFLFSFPGMYLIEKLGRRVLTLISLSGIAVSLTLLGIGFLLAKNQDPAISPPTDISNSPVNTSCFTYTSCFRCVEDENCGFCFLAGDDGPTNTFCSPMVKEGLEFVATEGSCAANSINKDDYTWFSDVCPSDYGPLIIVALCLYILFFASGLGGTPWAVNAEIYPLWCRSSCVGLSTAVNWAMNVVVSMTFLTLLEELGKEWTFILYAGISVVGIVILLVILPETKGKTLEEMEDLFSRPVYRLGLSNSKR